METAYSVMSSQVQAGLAFDDTLQSAACQATICCQLIFAVLTATQEECSTLQTLRLLRNKPDSVLQMTLAMLDMLVMKVNLGNALLSSTDHLGMQALLLSTAADINRLWA